MVVLFFTQDLILKGWPLTVSYSYVILPINHHNTLATPEKAIGDCVAPPSARLDDK